MSLGKVIPPIPTPVHGDLTINLDLMFDLASALLSGGADRVLLFGTTGEGTFFSPQQKLGTLAHLVNRGLPAHRMLMASGTVALHDTVQIIRGATELGCGPTLVLPPFFGPSNEEGLEVWFTELIARAQAAIVLYHIPQTAGVGFSPSLVRRLRACHPKYVVGLKDSSPGGALASQLTPDELATTYIASEGQFLRYLDRGGAGLISATLNVATSMARRTADRGDSIAQAFLSDVGEAIDAFPFIPAVKSLIAYSTGKVEWRKVTPPHRSLDDVSEKRLLTRYRELLGPQ